MKHRLLELLACPSCRQPLKLKKLSSEVRPTSIDLSAPACMDICGKYNRSVDSTITVEKCKACYREEIMEGLLYCQCRLVFPIVEGVPRLTRDAARLHTLFFIRNREALAQAGVEISRLFSQREINTATRAAMQIRKSFGAEWKIFNYRKDRTWGMTDEDRKRKFLSDVQLTAEELNGILILDAGCGNGVLTSAIGEYRAEVVGIDVSESVIQAHRHNTNPNVHFVNANLLEPPLKTGQFHILYSSGVLHHTPDPELTFSRLVPLIRDDGRYWVWQYSPQPDFKHQVMIRLRKVTCRLPLPLQFLIYNLMVPLALIKRRIKLALKLTTESRLNWREQLVNFFDGLSPRYRYEYTPSEVSLWFTRRGFSRVEVTGTDNYGFGMLGVMTAK